MLTTIKVKSLKAPGKYHDRDGLYLNVSKTGAKSWIYRYQLNGKRREIGLGSFRDVSLAEARDQVSENRKLHKNGTDPKEHRERARQKENPVPSPTFEECSEAYIKAHSPAWTNSKHTDQWRNTLKKYANPVLGKHPVDQIDTKLVMQVLEPIWYSKTETATRVRGRIENVLSWSIVHGHRSGPNPALWRGHLAMLLPQSTKIQKIKHHAALPYSEISTFMKSLRTHRSLSAQALQLTILTGCRTAEVLQAKWDEFDLEANIWIIPANRMKAGREHRVPLSTQADGLINSIGRISDWVFPSRGEKPLSNMAMLNFLKKQMGHKDLTVHGFRSTFRDWAAEVSPYPRELAESALAHVLSNQTEAAYQRGDLLEKRREMMQAWADNMDGE